MLEHEGLNLSSTIQSDTAPLHTLTQATLAAGGEGFYCMKDLTHGGIVTTLNEIALGAGMAIAL